MLTSFAAAALIAYPMTVSLQLLGVTSMTFRMIGAFAFAWLTYLSVTSIWLRCMPVLDSCALLEAASGTIETHSPGQDNGNQEWREHAVRAAEQQIRRDARSIVVLLLGDSHSGNCVPAGALAAARALVPGGIDGRSGQDPTSFHSRPTSDERIVAPIRQSYWMEIGLSAHIALIGGMLLTAELP